MTTKQLNQRQARWAEVLAEFYFSIVYRPGAKNVLADTLSRREQDTGPQEAIGKAYRTQALLTPGQLDPRITQDYQPSWHLSQTLAQILQTLKQLLRMHWTSFWQPTSTRIP